MAHCRKYFLLLPNFLIQAAITLAWCFLFSNLPTRLKVILSSSKYFLLVELKLWWSKQRGRKCALFTPNSLKIFSAKLDVNNIIEVQAFPESNDVVGLKDLYLNFDVSKSTINTVKDVIASGEDISGVVFTRDYYTSSYSNGDLERK